MFCGEWEIREGSPQSSVRRRQEAQAENSPQSAVRRRQEATGRKQSAVFSPQKAGGTGRKESPKSTVNKFLWRSGMLQADMQNGVGGGIVEDAGGKIVLPKTSIGPNGFMAHIIDTEGNKIALHSMK